MLACNLESIDVLLQVEVLHRRIASHCKLYSRQTRLAAMNRPQLANEDCALLSRILQRPDGNCAVLAASCRRIEHAQPSHQHLLLLLVGSYQAGVPAIAKPNCS